MRFRCFVIKQQFNLLSKIQNQSFKSQMKSRSDTMFFWDNERRIDMVLAYEDDEEDDEEEEEVILGCCLKIFGSSDNYTQYGL